MQRVERVKHVRCQSGNGGSVVGTAQALVACESLKGAVKAVKLANGCMHRPVGMCRVSGCCAAMPMHPPCAGFKGSHGFVWGDAAGQADDCAAEIVELGF